MNRILDIQNALAAQELEGVLLTSPINRRFATGFSSSAGVLVVTQGESLFVTDSRYIETARGTVTGARVQQIEHGESYAAIVAQFLGENSITRLGFEEETLSQATYERYRQKLAVELLPAGGILADLRAIKTLAEYALMQRAQAITEKTFEEILPLLTSRHTERGIAAEIVYRLMRNGAERPAFDPIVVSGPRASLPHGTPSDSALEGFIVLDFGAMYQGYCADMTRTVCIGAPTSEMRRVYDTVRCAQAAGISIARAGAIGKDVDQAARAVIEKAGYGAYFGHGFGHGLGLEVHESPRFSPNEERPLPKGAILSAEPGIYLPGRFGVRIEDTVYLTETGVEILTKTPKELCIL